MSASLTLLRAVRGHTTTGARLFTRGPRPPAPLKPPLEWCLVTWAMFIINVMIMSSVFTWLYSDILTAVPCAGHSTVIERGDMSARMSGGVASCDKATKTVVISHIFARLQTLLSLFLLTTTSGKSSRLPFSVFFLQSYTHYSADAVCRLNEMNTIQSALKDCKSWHARLFSDHLTLYL